MNPDETPFDTPRIVCRECESEEEHEFCNGFSWLERIRRLRFFMSDHSTSEEASDGR